MNLRTRDIKHLFSKYIESINIIPNTPCPTPEKIIEAIRFPSKKTRRIIDHIVECNNCLRLFYFFKELIREEDNFIDSLLRHQVINDELDKEKPECFFNVRFLKFVPYLTFTLFFSFVLFFSVRYVNMSKDSITRSFEAATYLSLVYDATPTEACPYLLKWDQIVQAKSYVIHIFDSSLNSVWNNITYECQIRLPSDICEQIESGHQLLISFEAENSEGNIIFSWMGELPLTKINSGQKELKIRLR